LALLVGLCNPAEAQEDNEIVLRPGTRTEERLAVLSQQSVAVSLRAPVSGEGATGTITDVYAGREVLQMALQEQGGVWRAQGSFESPGDHVLAVRLYQGERVWTASTDLKVLEPAPQNLPAGEAREELNFASSGGGKGGDVNGWWGIAAMLVVVAVVAGLSQVWKRKG
jgi:hypothetical protein